jgi:hypothetical protein
MPDRQIVKPIGAVADNLLHRRAGKGHGFEKPSGIMLLSRVIMSWPTYDLLQVQYLVRLGGRVLTSWEVARTIGRDHFDDDDISDCLSALSSNDFHKTMVSEKDGVTMLDVYRPTYRNRRVYIKFKLTEDGRVYVLSFKEDDQQ